MTAGSKCGLSHRNYTTLLVNPMEITHQIDIHAPLELVMAQFSTESGRQCRMPGLLESELLEGAAGQGGAVSQLKFKMGGRYMLMRETILENQLPICWKARYESGRTVHFTTVRIEKSGSGTSRYCITQDFEFKGVMRLLSFLLKSTFSKTLLQTAQRFKEFAEGVYHEQQAS